LAGAAGGCQAEIGSASSMAAGAIAYLNGAGATGIAHAAAIAMKNLLGLVCDPVAGLGEVPCVKRNVVGAVNALTSSDMVMAGMISKIPPDEVFDAMRAVGRAMPENVRETGTGGLAGTPTGQEIRERITAL
jgi:L-serine dehydratase